MPKADTDATDGLAANTPKSELESLDLNRLRLSQDFSAEVGVAKRLCVVPVRKPGPQTFFRVHPSEDYQFPTLVLEIRDDRERETYLVTPELRGDLLAELTPKLLILTISRQGDLSLWPIRLPREDGRLDDWNRSALEIAGLARSQWVRVVPNMSRGMYDAYAAAGSIPEPEWPDISLKDVIQIAFKDHFVNSLDHPAIRRLRGLD